MHNEYDITIKQIIDADPLAFVHSLGMPGDSATLVDTDIAVTAQADRVIFVACSTGDYLLHIEAQSTYKQGKAAAAQFYNMSLEKSSGRLVRTVFVLMRPEAQGPEMSGVRENETHTFRFRVVRMWLVDPKVYLEGPISLLPLGMIAAVARQGLPEVVSLAAKRLASEVTEEEASTKWLESAILLGLYYDEDFVKTLFGGVSTMQDSTVYQAILAEGKEELLSLQLERRFSTLSADITEQLDKLSPQQMNELGLALFDFTSLSELENWLRSH
jgi:hypothetical protein